MRWGWGPLRERCTGLTCDERLRPDDARTERCASHPQRGLVAINLGIPDVDDATEIGRGGFGVVYKAHQSRFDRTIAVKVLEQAQLDEAGKQRFERECKALGALSGHPNVVTIYDSGFTPAGWPYLVLE